MLGVGGGGQGLQALQVGQPLGAAGLRQIGGPKAKARLEMGQGRTRPQAAHRRHQPRQADGPGGQHRAVGGVNGGVHRLGAAPPLGQQAGAGRRPRRAVQQRQPGAVAQGKDGRAQRDGGLQAGVVVEQPGAQRQHLYNLWLRLQAAATAQHRWDAAGLQRRHVQRCRRHRRHQHRQLAGRPAVLEQGAGTVGHGTGLGGHGGSSASSAGRLRGPPAHAAGQWLRLWPRLQRLIGGVKEVLPQVVDAAHQACA